MNGYVFFFIHAIAYASLFIGVIVGKLASDELESGKKYFHLASVAILGCLLGVILLYAYSQPFVLVAIGALVSISIILSQFEQWKINAFMLGPIVSILIPQASAIICGLLFAFGISSGSFVLASKVSSKKPTERIESAIFNHVFFMSGGFITLLVLLICAILSHLAVF